MRPVGVKVLIFLLLLSRIAPSLRGQDTLDLYPDEKGCLVYTREFRALPRPMHIHYVYIDLTCSHLEVITLTGEDPDGSGPAESTLTSPDRLLQASGAIAAINANAFSGLPGTENDIRGWYRGRPVNIMGMAVADGQVVSPVQSGRTAFWIDRRNRPHLGNPVPGDTVWQAVSDWSMLLLVDGAVIPGPSVTTLHPRSAAGFDDSGKWLLLVVVDGRQPGFSEGISLHELALLFQSHGCTEAVNLDGGGSSILLATDAEKEIKTLNRPSGISHRPVPVMLGVRKRSGNKK